MSTTCCPSPALAWSASHLCMCLDVCCSDQSSLYKEASRASEGIRGHLALCRCCSSHNLQRSVAVEVKSVATDAGRAKFVHLLRYGLAAHCRWLLALLLLHSLSCQYDLSCTSARRHVARPVTSIQSYAAYANRQDEHALQTQVQHKL